MILSQMEQERKRSAEVCICSLHCPKTVERTDQSHANPNITLCIDAFVFQF